MLRLNKGKIKTPEQFSITMQAKDQMPLTVVVNLHIVETIKVDKLLEYAMKNQYSLLKEKEGFVTAIPETTIVQLKVGKYQAGIIKNTWVPFEPTDEFTFDIDADTDAT